MTRSPVVLDPSWTSPAVFGDDERTRRHERNLLALIVIALAVAAVLLGAPAPIRALFSLPALVLVAGSAATPLVLGRPPTLDPGPAEATAGAHGDDSAVRWLLTVLLGLLSLLASVLVVAVLGFAINTTSVVLAIGVLAALLLAVVQLRDLDLAHAPVPSRAAARVTLKARARAGIWVLTAGAVLVGAVLLAQSLRPVPTETYTVLRFTNATQFGPDPVNARPGQQMILEIAVQSYGYQLTAEAPTVAVSVAGQPARDVEVSFQPVQAHPAGGDPGDSAQLGAVAFDAPSKPGLYQVELNADARPEGADPTSLVTWLQVRS
jgi:uncharacterized membrane protein